MGRPLAVSHQELKKRKNEPRTWSHAVSPPSGIVSAGDVFRFVL